MSLLFSSKEVRPAAAIESQVRVTIMLINTFDIFIVLNMKNIPTDVVRLTRNKLVSSAPILNRTRI